MSENISAEDCGLVSRERVADLVRHLLYVTVHVEKRFTVVEIARRSGLKERAVRSFMANEPLEHRLPSLPSALSLAVVLGERAVNEVLSLIGYGGARQLGEGDCEDAPIRLVGSLLNGINIIAQLAADGEFCPKDREALRPTVDAMIAKLVPLSSAGGGQ